MTQTFVAGPRKTFIGSPVHEDSDLREQETTVHDDAIVRLAKVLLPAAERGDVSEHTVDRILSAKPARFYRI